LFTLIKKVLTWLVLLAVIYAGSKYWLTVRFADMMRTCVDSATTDANALSHATTEEKAIYSKQILECIRDKQNWLDRWSFPEDESSLTIN